MGRIWLFVKNAFAHLKTVSIHDFGFIRAAANVCFVVLAASIVGVFYFNDYLTKFTTLYGNPSSVLGLLVSVVGFVLTLWTILEAARSNAESQNAIREAQNATNRVNDEARQTVERLVRESRREIESLLGRIRLGQMEENLTQASVFVDDAKRSIRDGHWLRAIEKCEACRTFAQKLLYFTEIEEIEQRILRTVVEDLKTTVEYMEQNRLNRTARATAQIRPGVPKEKTAPLVTFADVLMTITNRLQRRRLEAPHVERPQD